MEGSERFPWEQWKGGEFYFCSQPHCCSFSFFFLYFFLLFCLSLHQRPLPRSFWQMTIHSLAFNTLVGKSCGSDEHLHYIYPLPLGAPGSCAITKSQMPVTQMISCALPTRWGGKRRGALQQGHCRHQAVC